MASVGGARPFSPHRTPLGESPLKNRDGGQAEAVKATAASPAGGRSKRLLDISENTENEEVLATKKVEQEWREVIQSCAETGEALNEALEAWKEEMSPSGSAQVTAATRRVKAKRLIGRLSKAAKELSDMQGQMSDLATKAESTHQRLVKADKSSAQAVARLRVISNDLEGTLERLKQEEAIREGLRNELFAAKAELEVARLQNNEAQGNIQRMEKHLAEERTELERLEAENAALRKEAEELREQASQAKATSAAKVGEATEAVQAAAESAAQAARYKEVVAKLTADNMVFLMKFHTCERRLQLSEDQCKTLRSEVELRRGEWLEKARAEVEDRVKESIRKAEASAAELQSAKEAAAEASRQAAARLEEVQSELKHEQAQRQEAEATLAAAQERLEKLEAHNHCLVAKSHESEEARREAQAEVRVLKAEVERLNLLLKEQTCHYKALKKELEELQGKLASKEADIDKLSSDLEVAAASLARQQAVNETLMKKKQEMEWQYLEALGERDAAEKKRPDRPEAL